MGGGLLFLINGYPAVLDIQYSFRFYVYSRIIIPSDFLNVAMENNHCWYDTSSSSSPPPPPPSSSSSSSSIHIYIYIYSSYFNIKNDKAAIFHGHVTGLPRIPFGFPMARRETGMTCQALQHVGSAQQLTGGEHGRAFQKGRGFFETYGKMMENGTWWEILGTCGKHHETSGKYVGQSCVYRYTLKT